MRASWFVYGVALTLAACNGGGSTGTSTGNPNDGSKAPTFPGDNGGDLPTDGPTPATDSNGRELGGGFCKADATELESVDTQTELGFSAADVLAFAAGTHEEAIRWHDNMIATLGPEKGEHRVTITLRYDGGDVRWMTPKPPSQQGGARDLGGAEPGLAPAIAPATDADLPLIGGGCTPWLEVDVHVTVETDGGALDESFDATLRSRRPVLGTVYAAPKPDELGGAFAPDQILQPGFELAQLDLNINFTPFGVSGRFDGVFEIRRGDTVGAGSGGGEPFADFGRKGCSQHYGAFPVALDEMVEATTAQDALDLVATGEDLAVSWNDGTRTTATMTFAPAQDIACVLLNDYFYNGVVLVVDGELRLQSADGRVDASWTASVRAELPASGALQQVKLSVERKNGSGLPEGNGIPGADLSSYDDYFYSFVIALAEGSAMGELKVTGFKFAECAGGAPDEPKPGAPADMAPSEAVPPDQGSGTPGCRGADMFDVLSGAFTSAQ